MARSRASLRPSFARSSVCVMVLSGRISCHGARSGSHDASGSTATGRPARSYQLPEAPMAKFLLWLILFVLCWPLALLALVAFPFVWLLLLPFKVLGIAVG